jgi:phosphatidylserine/phosphatidylglycerophosphate/cardiolipin synthase-like enzyme
MTMSGQHRAVVEQAQRLAAEMPLAMAQTLADAIEAGGNYSWGSATADILQGVSQPHYRALAGEFLNAWRTTAPDLSPQTLSLILLTAAASEQASRERQSVELVWTGPRTSVVPLRQTEQVILQVIESAKERLTVVSYAVYNIPRVCESLVQAAARGVTLRVIIEAWDRHEGRNTYDRLRGFGESVASQASVYLWPLEHRERDEAGKPGVLHVKCVVADGRWLFLSSANLTENAFLLNMELGVLISGGPLPALTERHFQLLIEGGVLAEP